MNWENPKVYAVKHKNLDTRMESRSGGIFTALSDYCLENGGVVYGCILRDDLTAGHFRAENKQQRNLMRGSKYIQSDMGDTFKNVKNDLDNGHRVLFSGTSCQVKGLKSFLGKEYDNLFCVDIVCHGVPSLAVWKSYLDWQEKRNGGKCISADFRNKKDYGWDSHVETLGIKDKNGKIKKVDSEVFKTIYYTHCALRPACYHCPYKSVMHPGDISIADYWGIDKAAPGFNDNKGVSLVLVNNDTAEEIFNKVSGEIDFQSCRIEDSMTLPLREPCKIPARRDEFWSDYHKYDFSKVAAKYGGHGIVPQIKKSIKKLIGKKQ